MSDSDTPQYAVTVMADYGSTRVVLTGDPRLVARDVIVQQKGADGAWVEIGGYNSMSDDYAYTNARDHAKRVATGAAYGRR
jgi:L-ascorbate metabolism protein UlaG (beta-lactamase superfamily)